MTDTALKFSEFPYVRPDIEALTERTETLAQRLDAADSAADVSAVFPDWQELLKEVWTAESLAYIHYHQDTEDERAEAERTFFDENKPVSTQLYVRLAEKMLASPYREALEGEWGSQIFAVLQSEVSSFDPQISEAMREEGRLTKEYVSLVASARIPFRGETYNLAALGPFYESADRDTRREVQQARWGFFQQNRERLDGIFHDLTQLRDGMGRALGHENYTPLAYQRMTRTDYGPDEVACFREQVVQHVVPVATRLRKQQAERLGLDQLMFHDEPILLPEGNPKPQGGVDWQVERATEMYRAMGPELGEFFEMMVERELLDLDNRPAKSGGGFCASLPAHEVPFIFATFNGTTGDVRVLTHECGHAFQGYMSMGLPLLELRWPTAEACEIHSMGMEFLAWPAMDLFFGDKADTFRKDHMVRALQFLPYGCAIDHFQHWIYQNPGATPADRLAAWQEMERIYLPHRNYDGLVRVADGGLWQAQRHVYCSPFYYIDYALAQTGALQFWQRSLAGREAALEDYVALCKLGGSRSYLALLESANLASPFESGTLASIVADAEAWLAEQS